MGRGLEDNLELGWRQGSAMAVAMILFYLTAFLIEIES